MSIQVEQVTEPVWLGEGPHWDHGEQALYYVNIYGKSIHRYHPESGKHARAELDGMPGFIIPLEGKPQHFVVGLTLTLVELYWSGGDEPATVVREIASFDQDRPKNRFNDGKADPRGRIFAGTMGDEYAPWQFEPDRGALYRIDPDGSVQRVLSAVGISNGLAWDLQQNAFYYSDSLTYAVRRFDYDIETGNISNPIVIFELKKHGLEGIVDGMTIDTDGNLWLANFKGSQVIKMNPRSGEILQKVPIPALQTTSATFGGPNFDTLYVTSGSITYRKGEEQHPPCGATFKVTGLGVRGHPNNYARLYEAS